MGQEGIPISISIIVAAAILGAMFFIVGMALVLVLAG